MPRHIDSADAAVSFLPCRNQEQSAHNERLKRETCAGSKSGTNGVIRERDSGSYTEQDSSGHSRRGSKQGWYMGLGNLRPKQSWLIHSNRIIGLFQSIWQCRRRRWLATDLSGHYNVYGFFDQTANMHRRHASGRARPCRPRRGRSEAPSRVTKSHNLRRVRGWRLQEAHYARAADPDHS